MANGTIEGTTSSTYCISKIEWSATANNDTNKSTVTATLYLKRTNDIATTGQEWAFEISIDGEKFAVSQKPLTVKNEWIEAMTATTTVDHNGDGTKSITISASGGNPDTSVKSISCSGTATLDTIARASSITSASDVTLGEKCNVKWTPSSASFRYKLDFFVEDEDKRYTTDAIHPNTTESYTYTGFTIPLDVAEVFTQSRTGTMKVILTTYSDSNATKQVGTQSETSITVTVPSSTLPTVSFVSVAPVHSLPEAFNGLYVQGYSKVKVMLNADTQYNAGIKYFDFTVEGNTYGSDEAFTSAPLASSGLISVLGHAVDTRDYDGYAEEKINVIPYIAPKVQNVTVQRCDAGGSPDDKGTYLAISAKRVYSKVESDGVQKNYCSVQYRYKSEDGSYPEEWETILGGDDTSTDEITTEALLGGALAVDSAYHVQVRAVDSIGSSPPATIVIPTERVYCHEDGARRSFTFGGYVDEDNTFAIASDIAFKAKGGIAPIGLYDTNDFNELIYPTGYYTSSTSPSAAGCANYPVDKTGVLEVISRMLQNNATGDFWGFAWQTYRTYDGEIYTRSYFSSDGWQPWKQLQMV